jgi:hypothetical protein
MELSIMLRRGATRGKRFVRTTKTGSAFWPCSVRSTRDSTGFKKAEPHAHMVIKYKSSNLLFQLLTAVIFLTATFLLCQPLLFKGYIVGHDGLSHLLWAQQFVHSVHEGIVYPQWVADANFGCGDASFIFYPPFTFFSYALAGFFTNKVLVMLSAMSFLWIFASGITMYLFCRNYLGRFASFIASLAYMGVPYHLVDLYMRAALAELCAFFWIPLIYYFLLMVRENRPVYFVGLSVSFAGLLMTHLPTALLFSPFLLCYAVLLLWAERDKKVFLSRLVLLGVGLGLSSIYLIPAMLEQKYVNIYALTTDGYMVINNFLFSRHASDIHFNRLVSQIAISTSFISAVALSFLFYLRKTSSVRFFYAGIFFALSALLSLFLMIPLSEPFWNRAPFFSAVQFPWRLLLFTSFFSSLSLAIVTEKLFTNKGLNRLIAAITGCLIICVVTINGFYSYKVMHSFGFFAFDLSKSLEKRGQIIRPDMHYDDLLKNYNLYFKGNLWLIDLPGFRPIWSIIKSARSIRPTREDKSALTDYIGVIQKKINESSDTDFSSEMIGYAEIRGPYLLFPPLNILRATIGMTEAAVMIPRELWKEKVFMQDVEGKFLVTRWEPEDRVIHINASREGNILLKLFYYPRWKAYINHQNIPIRPDPATGLVRMVIPRGQYDIRLTFEKGIFRSCGIAVSLISAVFLLFFVTWRTLKKRSYVSRRQ